MNSEMKKPDLGEGRASSNSITVIDPTTHQGRVLEALRNRPMSAAELQWELRIAHAPAVVRELIAKGYRIKPEPYPRAEGRPIRRYRLIESE